MAKFARIWKPNGKSVLATSVYSKIPFYCNNDNCDAEMVIVSMGEATAHFRSKSASAHKFTSCLRNDINFESDKYDKNLFSFNKFKDKMLNQDEVNIHEGQGGGGSIGNNKRIAPYTLKSIYAAYLESLVSGDDSFGDSCFSDFMRCKENYLDFISNPDGFYIVEGSYFYKIPNENAFVLNVPMFTPGVTTYHVRVNFANDKDASRFAKHHFKLGKKKYMSIVLIASEWHQVNGSPDYMAECTISKTSQHKYISI